MAAQPELLERMPSESTALPLEAIDPTVLPAIQRLLQRHGSGALRAQGQEIRFSWANVRIPANAISIALACETHSLLIELDHLGAVDPLLIGEPFELLPPSLRGLVVQRVIASLLSNAPRALAEAVQVTEVRWQATQNTHDWPIKLGFRLRRGDDGCATQGRLSASSADALMWLDEQLPVHPASSRANLHSLPIPIRLVLGKSDITTSVLRKLALGDVVWVQSARLTRTGVDTDCRIGARSVAAATIQHRQLKLKHTQGLAMTLQPSPAEASAPPKPVGLESDRTQSTRNLEVPVTFDAGEISLPLAQLERLQPGALLELPQDISDSTIQLRVGNNLIARGSLVAIGKRLGVRVTHVYLEEHEPASLT